MSSILNGVHKTLYDSLKSIIPTNRLLTDPIHTLAWGTDASFYRLIPKMVIKSNNANEIVQILRETSRLGIPVTFRAAGTSLSGQAVTDSVLIVAGDNWKSYHIHKEATSITLQPGILGARANVYLSKYHKKIGPDPASINSCMIGGIAANNASGMCCSTTDNSYQTVESMKIIFHDGTTLDTGDQESIKRFSDLKSDLLDRVDKLARKVKNNPDLSARISEKFKLKNTTGYSLNALVDFSDPIKIIEHLMIGSEGTLGFISEITYRTVDEPPFKATAFIIFPEIAVACRAAAILRNQPADAVEIIDRAGLRSVENNKGMPSYLKKLPEGAAALLVEVKAASDDDLQQKISTIRKSIADLETVLPLAFTDIPEEYNLYWKIRKGLFPSVGAMRETGTTVIIEDVAFPIEKLAEATLDLQSLFRKYNYHEAVIFGHARDGNLHFVFNQDFGTEKEIKRYASFMDEVAHMVVDKYNGSLKAEHGTGRNMAPYVEMEWGKQAYDLMKEIKSIFDPENLLNPGVILNDSPTVHIENLKPLAAVNPIVDKCIECGFCENICVSSDLTLSPRQRIVVLREIERLQRNHEEQHILASLRSSFPYEGDNTCATDGLCALNCPVEIDTGAMVKYIRQNNKKGYQDKLAGWVSRNMATVASLTRLLLNLTHGTHRLLGTPAMKSITGGIRKISGNRIPQWNPNMPGGSKKINHVSTDNTTLPKVVYFPSCINRTMGKSVDYQSEPQVTEKMISLLEKGGFEIVFPHDLENLCCGMAFSSKGFTDQGMAKSKELEEALKNASNNGEYPILCDMSPCLFTMKKNMEPRLKLYEPIGFILEHLVERLDFHPIKEEISVFSVCSAKKMGLEAELVRLAGMCSEKVTDVDANCCGFAGDKGFTTPELKSHGLRNIESQTHHSVAGYSTSRTCENGLTQHSNGLSFKSIIYLVDFVTTPKRKERLKEGQGVIRE